MSMSCRYPDRRAEEVASCSDMLTEQLAHFDLAYQYTVLLEEEVSLFFATVFGLHTPTTQYKELMRKGRAVQYSDALVYKWDDIPMIEFRVTPDPEGSYSFDIECHRLYDADISSTINF